MDFAAWLLSLGLNFTPHWTALAALITVIAGLRRAGLAALLGAATAVIGAAIQLHAGSGITTPQSDADQAGGPTLRVMSFNILYNNDDMAEVAAMIAAQDPDIIAFQELQFSQRDRLGEIAAAYPHRLGAHSAIWSKLPGRELTPDFAALKPWRHVFAEMKFEGSTLRVFATHVPRPLPYAVNSANRDALEEAGTLLGIWRPDLALGDFNATRFMPRLRNFLVQTQLKLPENGWRTGTVPVWVPTFAALRIDHIATGPCWRIARHWTAAPAGSNHRPVIADLAPIAGPDCPSWSASQASDFPPAAAAAGP